MLIPGRNVDFVKEIHNLLIEVATTSWRRFKATFSRPKGQSLNLFDAFLVTVFWDTGKHSLKLTFSPLKMVVSNRNLLASRGPLFSGAMLVLGRGTSENSFCGHLFVDRCRDSG